MSPDDILDILREASSFRDDVYGQAAAEIERLRAELLELKKEKTHVYAECTVFDGGQTSEES